MPEEYRSADAAAYQPVLAMDDTIDQDNEDADDQHAASAIWSDPNAATAKALLIAGLTVSFGSVAQCGLLGGLAQFAWSVLRNSDAASHGLSQRFAATSRVGFQGMQIGGDNRLEGATTTMWMLISKARTSTRVFVRNHTDLAMCQVAAYYKSYKRAAQDVSILVDGSGKSMNHRTHTHTHIYTYIHTNQDRNQSPCCPLVILVFFLCSFWHTPIQSGPANGVHRNPSFVAYCAGIRLYCHIQRTGRSCCSLLRSIVFSMQWLNRVGRRRTNHSRRYYDPPLCLCLWFDFRGDCHPYWPCSS